MRRFAYLGTLFVAMALATTASFAQDGKLKITVTPKQAYVFVCALEAVKRGFGLMAQNHLPGKLRRSGRHLKVPPHLE